MRLIGVVLVTIWLGLLGWIAHQWLYPARLPEVTPYEGVAPEPLDIDDEPLNPSLAGLPAYEDLLERPLFYPGRRPPAPEPETAPEPSPPPPPDAELTLVGVVVMPEGMRALIREDATQRVSRLSPGDNVANWRLEEVNGERVRLTRGDRNRVLDLVRNNREPTLERTPGLEIVPDPTTTEETPTPSEEGIGDEQPQTAVNSETTDGE